MGDLTSPPRPRLAPVILL